MGTHKNWSHLTKEYLEELYLRFGMWKLVAEHLGMEKTVLIGVRRRLGMDVTGIHPPKEKNNYRKSRLEPMKKYIVDMSLSGKNCAEIARSIGENDPEIVRDFLSKLNIPRQRAGARSGAKNSNWHGGRIVDKYGYILVKAPKNHPNRNSNGYIRLHRLVMEDKLGRFLDPLEVVHHIDGDKQNNDPDNLELFSCNGQHIQHEWTDPAWREHLQAAISQGGLARWRNLREQESDAA